MTHKRTAIRDAGTAAIGAISGLTVYENRDRPIDSDELPAAEIRTPFERSMRADKGGRSDRSLDFQVTVYTMGENGPEQAENWQAEIRSRLFGDSTLAALIVDMFLASTTFQSSEAGDDVYWISTQTWSIRYMAAENDPGA